MTISIRIETPDQPDVCRLIEDLDAYQARLYPAESNHGIDIRALSQPNVVFVVARDAGEAIGTGAVVITPQYGELKRMYVIPKRRGEGVSRRILQFLEQQALERGCRSLMLETGISQPEARGLYENSGYSYRAPFGAYQPDPLSVFMSKTL